MTIGAALVLIAVGAILRFALTTVATHGFYLHTIGDIMMIVGAAGLILSLFIWTRMRPRGYQQPAPPPPVADPDGFPNGGHSNGGYPADRYTRDDQSYERQYRR